MNRMKQTKKGFFKMSDDKIFEIVWGEDSTYQLLYKGKVIGEGRAPEELLEEYVRLMNWAYEEGQRNQLS